MKEPPLILIVDDVEYNLILLNQILVNEGYRVLPASNGKKCMEILKTEIPDIILLDVIMPEINGFDLAEIIKKGEGTKNIPIIFLSAVSDFETKLKGLEKGAVDYITKPYDDKEVIARVNLQLKVRNLEKERIEHIQKLEELNREKDNLLQVIAHDMRSPLTSIMLMSEFMINLEKNIDLEKIKKYSTTIFNSSKKILNLINQLMHSNKIEFSNLDITNFDLVNTIKHAVDLVNRMLERKSIKVETDFYQNEIKVNSDESKIDQILNNIIYNAIKFTNSNGRINIRVDLLNISGQEVLHIEIQDNGIGMNESVISELLTKKLNPHRDGTHGEGGTGLGISITKTLLHNLGGKIEIESQENVGTTVHLYLYKF